MPAAVLLDKAMLLHPTPQLAVMPDDPALGEFRKEFAGMLGTIEEYPRVPKSGVAFAGAKDMIDGDELLDKINKDPSNQVDARALLTARLMDYFLGDNDRHPLQWKWARLKSKDSGLWEPIGRDRDKVFLSYEGLFAALARKGVPSLTKYTADYPPPAGIFANALEFDRRTLASLDKAVWDSVATSLTNMLSDSQIDAAMATLPPEYARGSQEIAAVMKARRNGLRAAAARYYSDLWTVTDIHGTDADDLARIVRNADGSVDVALSSEKTGTYFSRRFLPSETKEIRLYLHDGEPMLYGKTTEKGIVHGAGSLLTADAGATNKDKIVVHNEKDENLSYLLTSLHYPDAPVPVGVFKAIERPTYDELMTGQVAKARELGGEPNLEKLVKGPKTWKVE
jgi:hypothetical protein